jgi:hypothetical protein
MDYILVHMLKHKIPLTLENWLALNYLGDKGIEDLGAEEPAEIPEAILANTKWVM